jgi:4-deoxy-L-threo-5-hexosulose-uronate ketol-isomerase
MDIRHPVHPDHAQGFTTEQMRSHFLITDLFVPGKMSITYSHFDRIITAGICPTDTPLKLEGGPMIGAETFFEGREGGVINIGEQGTVTIDGTDHVLGARDGLYIGKGAKEVSFTSTDPSAPAKMYVLSGPAHKEYPTRAVSLADARQVKLGSLEESNKRTIYQYIHPEVLDSCQLCMGMTLLEPNCVWNTMPVHTHERRMEVYLYFDMQEQDVVFHLAGTPDETRHLVVRNEEAVISPSWSIHSGVGVRNYTFIWGMVGENKTFTDMDHVPMTELK